MVERDRGTLTYCSGACVKLWFSPDEMKATKNWPCEILLDRTRVWCTVRFSPSVLFNSTCVHTFRLNKEETGGWRTANNHMTAWMLTPVHFLFNGSWVLLSNQQISIWLTSGWFGSAAPSRGSQVCLFIYLNLSVNFEMLAFESLFF